ncbi:MAG: Argininosuccinate lyase [Candidatus Roizmanbacteria bacterium GW2011_GWA2_35_19]|uniref:Argininosuccinate lyase n=2 Tax=Candidatus Roizmaniibacteriota TaxID=1752723 RepID=A0A0G0CCG1_9BACT|nr:MAG: Argininosuccinate lyase [Candidatus Roizmanbacteria bacterium GW2011_GWC2_35_12]KKP73761.1 MAG: Argininosuccinate lyase [Candidatus Roizmanbacteria bacterium GW2011_GWA2_35_19]
MNKLEFSGKQLKIISLSKKKNIIKDILMFINGHKEHMVQFSEKELVDYMDKGLTVLITDDQHQLLGFAKLYPWMVKNTIKGYEFSSWISKYPNNGIGKQLVDLVCNLHDTLDPDSDLFAIISSDNIKAISTLKKLGATKMKYPHYVKNLLKGKPETCMNLKIIKNLNKNIMKNTKIYEGIYTKGPAKITDQFIMDPTMTVLENKLAPYYVIETIAHNLMTAKCGIVPKQIAKKILKGLLEILGKSHYGNIIDPSVGDVHENVEKQLTDKIGDEAGWFHVARSRNDQTIVDQKLFTKKSLVDIFDELNKLEKTLLKKAEMYKDIIMPGFTHMRSAMPSSFGFWWQSYLDQILFINDVLKTIFEVYDYCPLGAGASYGVNWKIKPELTAKALGFSKPLNNGLSAINNRGIEDANIISQLAIIMTILSKMMEDLIIWSLPELNYVAISEEYTTGSSIMPQKMNPDICEKIKSKSSKLIANLVHDIVAMKGTPSGYNRDSAETKIAIMASLDEALSTIAITNAMISKVVANPEAMKKGVISSLPTKLADELVKKFQVPFRTAHKIVGKTVGLVNGNVQAITVDIVKKAIIEIIGKNLPLSADLVNNVFNVENALDHYEHEGSAGPKYVQKINNKLSKELIILNNWTADQKNKLVESEEKLLDEVYKFIKS